MLALTDCFGGPLWQLKEKFSQFSDGLINANEESCLLSILINIQIEKTLI